MAQQKYKLIDISADMLCAAPSFSDTPAVIRTESETESGGKRSILLSSLHNGTHITAPAAYIEGASSISDYPIERFFGECRVVKAKGALTGSWIDSMSLYRCDKLLIKGEGKGKIDVSAAEEIVTSGVRLIGTDADTIAIEPMSGEVGRIFAEADCLVLEGLRLEQVDMGTYFLMAQPILLEESEAAPCRAVLAEDYLYWNR
ncbi:MAG: cyclase family protein [Clostridia bacterium]|nr:cyclase family protein [Clostridia bacterium]